jgi:hypothetical protein
MLIVMPILLPMSASRPICANGAASSPKYAPLEKPYKTAITTKLAVLVQYGHAYVVAAATAVKGMSTLTGPM